MALPEHGKWDSENGEDTYTHTHMCACDATKLEGGEEPWDPYSVTASSLALQC